LFLTYCKIGQQNKKFGKTAATNYAFSTENDSRMLETAVRKVLKKFEIGKTGRPFALLSDLQLRLAKYVIHMQELDLELSLSYLILKKMPYNWIPKIRYQSVQQKCYYS
jgi:hypothetical protein